MSDFPKLPRIKQDDENMEKLHCAARRGQVDIVKRMIAAGVDANIQNKFGCTALHLACKHGQIAAVRELAPVSDLTGAWHGQKPLHLAVQTGDADLIQVLIDGVKEGNKDVASFLNESDEYELYEVAGKPKHVPGQTALHWVVNTRSMPMIKLLLSLGASPSAKDKNGETALMRCIEYGLSEEFDVLVEAPSLRLETSDRSGRTHLHWALLYNRPAMATKLFQMGHDIGMEDADKQTPWLLAGMTGMLSLLDAMLPNVDPFAMQQSSIHNGVQVLPERFAWLPSASDENVRGEVIKLYQKKLEAISKNATSPATKGSQPKSQPMQLAPSAPVKK